MGAIGGMLGLSGGAGGSGFAGPGQASIASPSTTAQANEQYTNANNALQQQQNFLAATQAQNGLGNQSNVYNQMQGIASGTGPNPAQAQLAQATGANVANQAAMMAGQRGSNANVGMIARNAAQQGAQTQQQAAGQGATLQAQQSLNALQGMGNLATQQAQQQAAATQANTQGTQGEQSNILNSIAGQNQANVNMQSNVNNANASMANTVMGQGGNLIGGMMNSAASMMSMMAEGGTVPRLAYGGVSPAAGDWSQSLASIQASPQMDPNSALYQGASSLGQHLFSKSVPTTTGVASDDEVAGGPSDTMSNAAPPSPGSDLRNADPTTRYAAKGGKVPALLSPGEQYLPPKDVKKVTKDGKNPLSVGERIPGKPKVKGNSYANDTVKKNLDEGGIVIPNSVMQSKNPHWEAMKFVHATMAKNRK